MSLMLLGYKMTKIKNAIKNGELTTKAQVKKAAKELDIAASSYNGNLSPEDKELWYDQLASNIFDDHNNRIPCFIDLGFGKELLKGSSGAWNYNVPKKQHWKIIVTRDSHPEWQFNAIVCTYSREEAICITKLFFGDFGGLGFNYKEPTPKTEHKAPWYEINSKKIGSYKDYVKSEQVFLK